MIDALIWLIKLPFLLAAFVLAVAFGVIGVVLAALGVMLTPVLGVGLLILPIGLVFVAAANLLGRLLRPRPKTRMIVLS